MNLVQRQIADPAFSSGTSSSRRKSLNSRKFKCFPSQLLLRSADTALGWFRALVLAASAVFIALGFTACDLISPSGEIPTVAPGQPTIVGLATAGFASPTIGAPTRPPATPSPTITRLPTTAAKPNPPATAPLPTTASVKPGASSPTLAPNTNVTCPPAATPSGNPQLAAKVNTIGIPLDRYNREVQLAQAAVPGIDPRTATGQDTIKSIRQQVLAQLIDEAVIVIAAEQSGIKITDADINAQLATMVQTAGGVAGLNSYLGKRQISLADLCNEMRAQAYGAKMLDRVTANLPATADQVHVRQIILSSNSQAQTIRDQLRRGGDFAALAGQYSIDPGTKSKGGDLGWVPKGILDPQLESAAFSLQPGQVSDVITTRFGYTIVQVTEKDASHPLSPEMMQTEKQQLYLTWLQAARSGVKIDQFVTP